MKFSVLLPTRNGGNLLNDCIGSVLDQSYQDIELIISDNCSEPDTVAVIRRFLDDPRVTYRRQGTPLSVSENWTKALEASSGDYFVMMGDDDCLLPHYFDTMNALLNEYRFPDCIHYLGYLFVMQGVIEGENYARYDPSWAISLPTQGLIPKPAREQLVRSFFDLRGQCQFNSQLVLVSRKFTETLSRGFYVAPYPDFYSMSVLLLEAERFVFMPCKPVVVGVSPKSAGYYYSNRRPGVNQYFGYESGHDGYSPMLDSVLDWLDVLSTRYGDRLGQARVESNHLARSLVAEQCRAFSFGEAKLSGVLRTAKNLRAQEYVTYLAPRLLYHLLKRCHRRLTGRGSAAASWFRRTVPFSGGGIGAFAQAVAKGEIL